jgi:hypothetical protein
MPESLHLVDRVPEVIHRLLTEVLTECVSRSINGEEVVHVSKSVTLHERERVHADLTITFELTVSDK